MNDLFNGKTPWLPELYPLSGIGKHDCGIPIEFKAKTKLPYTLLEFGKSGEGLDYTTSLNKKPKSEDLKEASKKRKEKSNKSLAKQFKRRLRNSIMAAEHNIDRIKIGGKYAELFVDRLTEGNGETWKDDGTLSEIMGVTPEVKTFKNKICSDLKNLMLTKFGHFWDIKLDKNYYSHKDNKIKFKFSSSPTLKGLVGGTQKTIVTIEDIFYGTFNRTWNANLILHIEDDFGVEESDYTNPRGLSAWFAKPALADFWVLQHQRGKKPFTTVFEIPFNCQGNF